MMTSALNEDGSGPERRAGVETMSWEDFKAWLRRLGAQRSARRQGRLRSADDSADYLTDSPSERCDHCEHWNADHTCEKVIGNRSMRMDGASCSPRMR